MSLTPETAKKFFASLYANPPVGAEGNFEAMTTKLVAKLGDTVVSGDQALQSLMMNYVLSSAANVEKGKKLTALLGGIKQKSVTEFSSTFPTANLDELIKSAKEAGYEVEVLK